MGLGAVMGWEGRGGDGGGVGWCGGWGVQFLIHRITSGEINHRHLLENGEIVKVSVTNEEGHTKRHNITSRGHVLYIALLL